MLRLITFFSLFFGMLFCGIVGVAAYQLIVFNDASIYAENSLLENVQAILLVANTIGFLGLLWWQKKHSRQLLEPLALWFLAYLNFAFFLREVDPERMNIPWALQAIGSGVGRNTLLVFMLAAIAMLGVRHFHYYYRVAKNFLFSQVGCLVIFAGVCLVAASVLDTADSIHHHAFYEEVLEYLAYLTLWISDAVCWNEELTDTRPATDAVTADGGRERSPESTNELPS